MSRYFDLYGSDYENAIRHYKCNIKLAESCYTSLTILELSLRNALSRELEKMTGREDWYAVFSTTDGLNNLNKYIELAKNQISNRHETITPPKIVAELTLGFWVSLMNSEYERILWKYLRKAFPYLPKEQRQRRKVSSPLNSFRSFRNRIFHNESICWNLTHVENIHASMIETIGWINKDIPSWMKEFDRFPTVCNEIRKEMGWIQYE